MEQTWKITLLIERIKYTLVGNTTWSETDIGHMPVMRQRLTEIIAESYSMSSWYKKKEWGTREERV